MLISILQCVGFSSFSACEIGKNQPILIVTVHEKRTCFEFEDQPSQGAVIAAASLPSSSPNEDEEGEVTPAFVAAPAPASARMVGNEGLAAGEEAVPVFSASEAASAPAPAPASAPIAGEEGGQVAGGEAAPAVTPAPASAPTTPTALPSSSYSGATGGAGVSTGAAASPTAQPSNIRSLTKNLLVQRQAQ